MLRALDLFCCAGGATKGLQRAGFHVTGIDNRPQPRYCGDAFIQADALKPPVDLAGFDLIWASPPCQAHCALRHMPDAKEHEDRIPETRALLESSGRLFVIENVPGAPLNSTVMLCGTSFGLRNDRAELRRHRHFETNFFVLGMPCRHHQPVLGVYGGHIRDRCRTITVTGGTPQTNVVRNRVRQTYSVDEARAIMGIDWMTMADLSQAIPPAYAEFIGRWALRYLDAEAA